MLALKTGQLVVPWLKAHQLSIYVVTTLAIRAVFAFLVLKPLDVF
jgi:hypothetical protein